MKFRRLECALLIAVAALFTYAAAASCAQDAMANGLLRLHVVANSDTPRDQEIKLLVRDEVLRFCAPILEGAENREAVRERLLPNLQALANHARQTLKNLGESRAVSVKLAEEYYPTRDYTKFSLPAGEYLGLRVTIGEGAGQNWWCVVFPPLCLGSVTESTEETALSGGFDGEQVRLITGEDEGYVVKFKAIELWEQFCQWAGET